MRRFRLTSLVLLLLLGGCTTKTPFDFDEISSYKIFYNIPTEAIIEDMTRYDLVIIEPIWYTPEQIEAIRSNGTKVLGYINVMEADTWNRELIGQMKQDDFFYRDGERIYFPKWDSYLTDISSDHFRKILMREIQKQVINKHLDGIFLDTVGDIDDVHLDYPEDLTEQLNGLEAFLKAIKQTYPGIPIVQNWGIETLERTSAPYVDGFMWEGFNYSEITSDSWSMEMLDRMNVIQEQYGIAVLTVSDQEAAISRDLAEANGFIHYHEPTYYDTWDFQEEN
ncbi:endo alpha-1,4 polygalactosaminidase [Exiguobacterium sp. SH31]|uniref:putative glycoside hydrolase n=1 Tax=Exiguobacterium sp. SH31 TaxID=1843183 RepID=UPI000ADDE4E1|nr:endo alpha-1,4 polygalactosaminidase [Exiguobacterium sp. SH31]